MEEKAPSQTKQAVAPFPGFQAFAANVTFTPIQFFTVTIPHSTRGCVRIVGYMIRKILGWVDENGVPTTERLTFTYRELIEHAGISHETIADAIEEAIDKHFIRRLVVPRAKELGKAARSGVYELNWQLEGDYTDAPDKFRGFFYPEAAVFNVQESGKVVARAKSARKNIPNAFFDYLLPNEKLSVIRTVGALLFYSIEWGKGGERKVNVSKSITDLSNLTNLSRQHVHKAITEAITAGYMERVTEGTFNLKNSHESEAATYGIRWAKSEKTPLDQAGHKPNSKQLISRAKEPDQEAVQTSEHSAKKARSLRKGERTLFEDHSEKVNEGSLRKGERTAPHRSEKVNEGSLRKGERERSEKVTEDHSEKVTSISIKTISIKTPTTAASQPLEISTPEQGIAVADLVSSFALLLEIGFDAATAKQLSEKYPEEVIQRQIHWIPLRTASKNKLGLLRRAIEEDWGAPSMESSLNFQESGAGLQFAKSYYAGYHGNSGNPIADPFPKDTEAAAKLVERLFSLHPDKTQVDKWGRSFGRLVRQKYENDSKAKPFLSTACVLYGDEFFLLMSKRLLAERKDARQKAQAAHHEANLVKYREYLRAEERRAISETRGLYEAFRQDRQKVFDTVSRSGFGLSDKMLALFNSEESRLDAFLEFFSKHPQQKVLSFWDWDKKLNDCPFESKELRT